MSRMVCSKCQGEFYVDTPGMNCPNCSIWLEGEPFRGSLSTTETAMYGEDNKIRPSSFYEPSRELDPQIDMFENESPAPRPPRKELLPFTGGMISTSTPQEVPNVQFLDLTAGVGFYKDHAVLLTPEKLKAVCAIIGSAIADELEKVAKDLRGTS